jgi:pilus assembly protein CpaF
MFAIIVHEKGGTERREIFDAAELSVGRVQGNELMLPKGNVSKRHARLLYRDGRFIVTDLNSTNGTYVNRRKITQATIVREGDRIYIGDFVLRIEASGEASPDEFKTGPSAVARSSPSAPDVSNVSVRPEAEGAGSTQSPPGPGPGLKPTTTSSNPISSDSPARLDSPAESTGTHTVGRTTQDDRGEVSPNSVLDVVRALVDRVALRLSDVDLLLPVPPSLGERIDGLLQDAWTEVSEGRNLPASVAPERAMELARCELVEHGPLTELIADPAVSEVGVTRFDRVLSVRGGRSVTETGFSSDLTLRWAVSRLCAEASAPLLPGEGVIERRIMPGVRLSAVIGAIAASGACVAIRKTKRSPVTLEDLVRRGAISRAMATFLQQCLAARVNVLVVGPRDGGVEALLTALAQAAVDGPCVFLGERDPGGSEANLLLTGSDSEQTAGALQVAASMPGARIVTELFSGDLCARIVEAIADGGDGVIAARYAPSLRRGLSRLPGVVAAERPQIRVSAARELVANAFEIVVEVARLRDDRHRVLRIAEVIGCTGDDIQTQDVFTFVMDRTAAGGAIEGVFSASGVVPQVAEAWRARGTTVESAVFSRPSSR